MLRTEHGRVDVAAAAPSAETLRKIETGRAPTPACFTVAAPAGACGLSLDEVATPATPPGAATESDRRLTAGGARKTPRAGPLRDRPHKRVGVSGGVARTDPGAPAVAGLRR
ncbi:hypothetical protein [Streptomyces lydicus]|uniref:hypothetical protein n=1 Tax=Streptomyces lydicus TaxID=47763 RepID=UPI003711A04B